MRYSPGLDGLRGMAVLAVVASHVVGFASGGALGVDVFFVISGYLITGILLAEWDQYGSVSFKNFYLRRVLRLAPALLIALAISLPLLWGPMQDTLQVSPWVVVVSVVSYVGNWVSVVHPDALGPLDHTWSLAIEEQFYLLWPPFLLLMLRSKRFHKRLPLILSFGIGLVVVSRVVGWLASQNLGLYYATTARADGLLIGCLVAVVWKGRAPGQVAAWGAIGALGSLMLVFKRTSGGLFLGGFTIADLLAAVLIMTVVASKDSSFSRVMSWKPLVTVGRLSYGIYLYHFVIMRGINDTEFSRPVQIVSEIVLTAIVTWLSWRFVERPMLLLKHRFVRVPSKVHAAP